MISLEIKIPKRLYNKISNSELDDSELIIKALDKYFQDGPNAIDLLEWQTFVENKLSDLQIQLDKHVSSKGNHDTVLDTNVTKRNNGDKNSLDLSDSKDVRVTYCKLNKNDQIVPNSSPIISTIDDFYLPL